MNTMNTIDPILVGIEAELGTLRDLVSNYKIEFNQDRLQAIVADFKRESATVTSAIKECKNKFSSISVLPMQKAYYIKTLAEQARQFYVIKTAFHDVVVDRSVRQGLIVRPDLSETELRNMTPQLINQLIIEAADEATAEYRCAVERAVQINQLVRSIEEVAVMVQDLVLLVSEQSTTLDHIESTIETAVVHVKKSNDNMRVAVAVQKRTRKCWCLLVCVVLILILIVVGTVTPIIRGGLAP